MEDMDADEVDARFQKPSKYLKFLPLPKNVWEKDADYFLNHVKTQLSAAVMLLDIKQGAKFWAQQLQRYMKLYGLRFSKKDHIDLVKLMFELIVTLDQEASITLTFSQVFSRLMRKKGLLTPDELSLPWRPVYELWKSLVDCKDDAYGRKFLPPYVESMVTGFVKSCRMYFPVESTQEMLNEWRPMICPFDMSMNDAFDLFALFLPTAGPVERHQHMYRLWFDEFMGIYKNLDGARVGWEAKLLSIFSRVAGHNIGLIDWEPHLPQIFSRILKAFGLPVGPSKYHLSHADPSYEFSSSCLWVVAMISPTNSTMSLISQFIKTIEPFLHPSNHGWFQRGLHGALVKLCCMFTARVKLERYKKPCWDNYIPEDQKLSDEQITEFVDIVKPVVLTGLFSKNGPQDMTTAMFNLAFLRPERVLPQHLENLYQALENLTEPHRLKATLAGTLGIARALVSNPDLYPEGRLHAIPILQLCLPGIDSNDSNKTIVTFQLITTLATLIPLVDCSEAYQMRTDLTENERELCSQTAQIQDFIFIFIDRIFSLIEGLSLDHSESAAARAKASSIEAMIEAILRTAAIAVFQQTSTRLFKLSFDKVWNYISTKVYEVLVAGRLATALMYGLVRAKPAITLPYVIPHCCRNILELTESKEVATDERADNSLLWYLLLLSETMRLDGTCLVQYAPDIEAVLDRTLHMTNLTGHVFACNILERYFKTIGSIYPVDMTSVETSLDTPLTEYLPIRDWGASVDLDDITVRWHIPSSEGLAVIQSMFSKFIIAELKYLDENEQCEREDLQRRLRIITECMKGAGHHLPPLESEEHILEHESVVERVPCTATGQTLNFTVSLNGENAKNKILNTIQPLMKRLLDNDDSAKPLHLVAIIYRYLLLSGGMDLDTANSRAKGVKGISRSLANPLLPKSTVRMVHVEMAYIQQTRLACQQVQMYPFTKLHTRVYKDLVQLATSRYDDVQSSARSVLAKCFMEFKGSLRLIIPELCRLLITPPPEITEEQFKGALGLVHNVEGSIMGGAHCQCMAILRDIAIHRPLWPAIIQAQHSEKPNIQIIADNIIKRIEKNFETTNFVFPVSEGAKGAAAIIRDSTSDPPELDLARGQAAAVARTEKYQTLYRELVNELVQLIASDKLQWKHREFAMEMVAFLQRNDTKPSLPEVKLFSDNLTHDTAAVRKLSIGTATGILYSQKRRHPRRYVSSSEFSGYEDLQYKSDDIPDTEEKWTKANFVEKTFWGCTVWPEQVPVTDSCPPPTPDELTDEERYTLDKFSEQHFTDAIFKYLALEDKEKDRFSRRNYLFFKGLARNYGPAIVECCKSSIVKLQNDTDHQTETSRQRLVAEFVTGVVRGSKYWSFTQMNELYDWILPTVKKAITNVSNDAMTHWGTAMATCGADREPRKLYRLYQFLLEEVKTIGHSTDSATSLETTSRLYFLQGALRQQQWRIPELNTYTTKLIRERLASPFKSIRTRLGSVLCSCYVLDVPFMNKDCWHNPVRSELINSCLPLIKDLEDSSDAELEEAKFVVITGVTPIGGQTTPIGGQATPTGGRATPTGDDSTPPGDEEVSSGDEQMPPVGEIAHPGGEATPAGTATHASLATLIGGLPLEVQALLTGGSVVDGALKSSMMEVEESPANGEMSGSDKRNENKLIFKTMLSWIHSNFDRHTMYQRWTPEMLEFLPIICPHTANFSDPELRTLCQTAAKYMSKTLLPISLIPKFIHTIREAIGLSSWHARATVLEILQSMMFINQFTLSEHSQELQDIIVHLLSDEQIEVKLMAATTLSGGIQCRFFNVENNKLLDHFKKLANIRLRSKNNKVEMLQRCHTGLLGLGAVVRAYPYDVPNFVPELLMILSDHVHDPQPIQKTVKDVLSEFKRTHHDNWMDHKQKFTDDQLVVLTNLLVSPNYYA